MLYTKFLYLLVDLVAIGFPLLFSFHSKANFSRKWKYLWVALLITTSVFTAWDEWFTSLGVWGFNKKYLLEIYFGSLPLEEILFFICIPYACVFVYEASNYFFRRDYLANWKRTISLILIGL